MVENSVKRTFISLGGKFGTLRNHYNNVQYFQGANALHVPTFRKLDHVLSVY